ncbi:hypothetical protein N9T26_02350 [Alphaproteobacteria bacterium]|nr:hypothetical protein [Alphaproteobacteria bacterium]
MRQIIVTLIVGLMGFANSAGAEIHRLECDFTNREKASYIREFIGSKKWLIEIDLANKIFTHMNHTKRIDDALNQRPIWADRSGKYATFDISERYVIATKRQLNFQSEIKLDLLNGHLHEEFAIKRSSYGNAMDWNHEYADADCKIVPFKPLNLKP